MKQCVVCVTDKDNELKPNNGPVSEGPEAILLIWWFSLSLRNPVSWSFSIRKLQLFIVVEEVHPEFPNVLASDFAFSKSANSFMSDTFWTFFDFLNKDVLAFTTSVSAYFHDDLSNLVQENNWLWERNGTKTIKKRQQMLCRKYLCLRVLSMDETSFYECYLHAVSSRKLWDQRLTMRHLIPFSEKREATDL